MSKTEKFEYAVELARQMRETLLDAAWDKMLVYKLEEIILNYLYHKASNSQVKMLYTLLYGD